VSAAVQLSLIRTSRTSCCPPQIGLPDCLPGCELAPALAFDYENLLPPTQRRCAAWAPLALSIGFPDPNSGLPRSRSAGLAIRPDLRRVVHRRFAVFAGHFNSRCGPESPDERNRRPGARPSLPSTASSPSRWWRPVPSGRCCATGSWTPRALTYSNAELADSPVRHFSLKHIKRRQRYDECL